MESRALDKAGRQMIYERCQQIWMFYSPSRSSLKRPDYSLKTQAKVLKFIYDLAQPYANRTNVFGCQRNSSETERDYTK